MSRVTNLLDAVRRHSAELAGDLEAEIRALSNRRAFGLNFERHTPETVELPLRAVRRGDKVAICKASDGEEADDRIWTVSRVSGTGPERVADLVEHRAVGAPATCSRPTRDLVVVAEFRDPIFPGLRSTGRVARGGIKPCQVVINGENFHALETILFAYEGKVDCIYIDPPYNTRDKDWKYNNNYVDSDDAYRHSKWLAMMERRLRLAKRLLNPERSVLIITIDEKEVHRLGLLLEQIFSGATIQMVTTLIKPSGSTRAAEFSRVEEYINFVMIGDAFPTSTSNDMLRNDGETAPEEKVTWHGLRRRGSTDWRRADRPNQFYPVFVDTKSRGIHSVGEAMPLEQDRASVSPPKGTFAAWPLAPNGAEGRSGRNAFNS